MVRGNKVLVVDLSGMITFWDDTRQAYLPICPECFPEREQLEYRFADAALSDDEFLLSDFTSMVLLDDAILQHGQAKGGQKTETKICWHMCQHMC